MGELPSCEGRDQETKAELLPSVTLLRSLGGNGLSIGIIQYKILIYNTTTKFLNTSVGWYQYFTSDICTVLQIQMVFGIPRYVDLTSYSWHFC